MVKVTKPSTMEEISHAISVYQRFDHFTRLSYSWRTKRGRTMDFWTFPPSSLSDLPDLLRTDNQNIIETKTMDSWLYKYGRFILDWTSHRKTALPSLFSDVHRFLSGTSVSQYRDGIVSTLGRPVMHRKNDSRSRSLVTTRLYDSRTLVLSICPGSFTNIESYSSMCGWIRFPKGTWLRSSGDGHTDSECPFHCFWKKWRSHCGGASTRRLQSEVCCQRLGSCHEKSHWKGMSKSHPCSWPLPCDSVIHRCTGTLSQIPCQRRNQTWKRSPRVPMVKPTSRKMNRKRETGSSTMVPRKCLFTWCLSSTSTFPLRIQKPNKKASRNSFDPMVWPVPF